MKILGKFLLATLLVLSLQVTGIQSYASGTAKPNVANLGPEVKATVISQKASSGSSGLGLFDGTTVNEWSIDKVCYWQDTTHYVEVSIPEKCNIWRAGTTSWSYHNEDLVILQKTGDTYTDVTSNYIQKSNSLTEFIWEKAIANLPAGQYKFMIKATDGGRIDSEWYLEGVNGIAQEEYILESTTKTAYPGDIINVDLTALNAQNLCASDVRINYDTDKFEFVATTSNSGIVKYHESVNANTGEIKYIFAVDGKENVINGTKTLASLKFKVKGTGNGKIDIMKVRIADNGTYEKNVSSDKCGEMVFDLKKKLDVNRDGSFTLIDLGIDAYYKNFRVVDTDTTKYDTDVVINNMVDEADLSEIVKSILANDAYEQLLNL